jgi:Transposase IS116/IS110/IS902 family
MDSSGLLSVGRQKRRIGGHYRSKPLRSPCWWKAQVTVSRPPRNGATSISTCVRLQQIPGVDPQVATGSLGHWKRELPFKWGRDFAVWLGLVPGQCRPEGRQSCWESVSGGNPHLRKIFIHAARALVLRTKREGSYLGQWLKGLEGRPARDPVIVATANKLAKDLLGGVVERGKPSPYACPYGRQLDEVTLKFASQ